MISKTRITTSLFVIGLFTFIVPTSHANMSLDELYRMCRAVDAAVDGVELHATGAIHRRPTPIETIQEFMSEQSPRIQHPSRNMDRFIDGFIQERDIRTFKLGGRIELKISVHPSDQFDAQERTEIYDVDKRVNIGSWEQGTDKQLVDIDDRPILIPVHLTGIYHFGRGLSEFIGYPMEIKRRDDGRYDLTVWDIDKNDVVIEFILNPEYGMCWEEATFYGFNEGSARTHAVASQYHQHEGVFLPNEVKTTTYRAVDGEIQTSREYTVTNVSFIKDKDEVMQQLQLLNLVKPDDVVIDSRGE